MYKLIEDNDSIVQRASKRILSEIRFRYLLHEVKESINERLSISDEVVAEANRISNIIMGYMKKSNFSETGDNEILLFAKSEQVSLFGYKFILNINSPYYINKEAYKNKNKFYSVSSSSNFSTKEITINIDIIGGNFNKEQIYGTVQHEIEHVYQMCLMGKDFLYKGTKSGEIYNKSTSSKKNDLSKIIGNALYFSYKFEIDGNINGLYQLLKQTLKDFQKEEENEIYHKLNDTLKSSVMYTAIDSIDKALEVMENISERELREILKDYDFTNINLGKLSKERLYKQIKNGKIYLFRKLNKMLKLFYLETNFDLCNFATIY